VPAERVGGFILVGDLTELMTSLCAWLYGRRSASHRAARAVEVATTGGGCDG
jgi:predicted site-specific integrase-resolvase